VDSFKQLIDHMSEEKDLLLQENTKLRALISRQP
jgi:hypothetical protein